MNLPSNLLPAHSLSQRNTLGFEVEAEFAIHITEAKQIAETLVYAKDHNMPYQVLGGGSNVVLPSALPGLTLLMDIAGIEIVSEDANGVSLKVGAGVSWHSLVIWTLEHSYPGLENLALIPGTVGAAPIQNIGAYGVEIENYINSVHFVSNTEGNNSELQNMTVEEYQSAKHLHNLAANGIVITEAN